MKDENPPAKTKYKDVTAADVKASKGYEGISDELAQGIADAIRVYTEVIYGCFTQSRFDNQSAKVVAFTNQEENKKAA